MELYITIHILVFLSCLFEFTSLKTKKKVIIIWGIFFTLFGGLRWRIGNDWDQYYDHFLYSNWNNIFNYDRYGNGGQYLEPLFVFLNALIKSIFGTFYWYNILICLFIQYSFYKFSLKYSQDNPIMLYAFCMIIVPYYFPVRAALAIVVCYWSYKFIKERKFWKFLIIALIATNIHYQCILILPFYWSGKIKWNLISATCIYISFVTMGYIFRDYIVLISSILGGGLSDKLYGYTQHETIEDSGPSIAGWILNYLFLFVYLHIQKKKKLEKDFWYNSLITMFLCYNGIFIVFSEGMSDLTRLASIFFPAQAILFFNTIKYYTRLKNKIFNYGIISFYIVYYIYKLRSVGTGVFFESTCIPYKTIFDYPILY